MTKHQHLIACLLLLGTAGCGNSAATDPKQAYQRGLAALENGEPRTARVEFLNAIKADPNNAQIRLAQAQAYLKLGDGVAAEAEIARARQLGVPAADTKHLMAHAILLQGDAKRAIEETAGAAPAHAAYAARMRGRAYMALGDEAAAAKSFNEALSASPKDSATWLDVSRFRRTNGDVSGALQTVDQALTINPRDIEALIMRGELTRSQYGLNAALPWFNRAVEVDPDNVMALLERAATLGDLGQMRGMLAETRKVLGISGNNPMAFYLQSMLAARARKYELARSLYQKTGGALDKQPAGMLLSSAIDYQTGNVEQAINRLEQLVAMQPANRKARRLLAASHWKQGDAAATIETLRPLAEREDADSYSLALMGQALQRQGDSNAAAVFLARASQPQPQNPGLLPAPVSDKQLAMLRRSADGRPGHAPSQILLIGALLSRGMGDEGLDRARRLQAQHPGAPDAHVLVGDALGMKGDFAGAAQEYKKAANLAFTEPVALRMIEALQRSGQGPAATQVLNLFLQQNPRNVPAQLLAANGYLQAKKWPEAIRLYEGLRKRLGDRDAAMLNNLAWAYSEVGQMDKAIPLAKKAWALDKDNPATTDTLGWLLFKSGTDKAQGLALLERAARGAPNDAQIRGHLEVARRG